MIGPSVPLFGIIYTELQDRLYLEMQPCDHCVDVKEPGVDGGPLSRRISFDNRVVCSQVHHRHCRVHAATKLCKRAEPRKEWYKSVDRLSCAM